MNKGFQVGWWLITLTVLIIFGLSYIGADWEGQYLPSIILECFILIPLGLGILYAKKHNDDIRDVLGLKKFPIHIIPSALLLTAGAQYFITYITIPVQNVLIIMFGSNTATSQMIAPKNAIEFLLAFFSVCIVAPVIEELLCRGVLFKLFERYGASVALISSSLAFTLLHFEPRSFLQIFFVGALFGVFRLYTGSTVITIIMHSFNNLLSLCQLMLLEKNQLSVLNIVILILALLFPIILYFTFVKERKYFGFVNMTKEKTGFSFGALICCVIFSGYNTLMFLIRLVNGDCLQEIYNMIGW